MSEVISNSEIMNLNKITGIHSSDKNIQIINNNLYVFAEKDTFIYKFDLNDFKIVYKI
jgi:hypothetical protein